jgi:uncharacterized protein YijF (DUF1287 family)
MERRTFLGVMAASAWCTPAFAQATDSDFGKKLATAAKAQVGVTTLYDPSYVKLAYPMGDLPLERGVCSDVVVRAFRSAGADLQQVIHEDMTANFSSYPKLWGLRRPDFNIDHRRVPNLEALFKRKGGALVKSREASAYRLGDIVSWRLTGSGLPHIGVVTQASATAPLVTHNIGAGAQEEPVLFDWPIEGWFRFERWV